MRERTERQIKTLGGIARFARKFSFTNERALHLKEEILAHYARAKELVDENQRAKLEPLLRRGGRHVTKKQLREFQLIPLSRRGRKLSRVYPELTLALQVPHKNATTVQVADAAERFADALEPHLKFLIAAKYPPNCLKTLRDDARTLRARAVSVQESRNLLNRSNRELREELALARSTIDELDAVLRSLKEFPLYEIDWNIVNRVGARMGRPSKRRLAARERSAAKRRQREEERPTLGPE
jgi:hypothetical protein